MWGRNLNVNRSVKNRGHSHRDATIHYYIDDYSVCGNGRPLGEKRRMYVNFPPPRDKMCKHCVKILMRYNMEDELYGY